MNVTALGTQAAETSAAVQSEQRARLRLGIADASESPSVRVKLSAAGVAKALSATAATESETRAREESLELNYERRERSVLRLKTQEGDVVSISLRSRSELSLDERLFTTPDRASTEIDLGSVNEKRLIVTVRGDLNESELAAIGEAAAQATALANDFFSGNLDGAVAAATEFGIDPEQLARVSLRLGVEEKLSVSQTVALAAPAQPNAIAGEAQSTDNAQALRPVSGAAAVPNTQAATALARPDAPVQPPAQAPTTPSNDGTTEAPEQDGLPNLLDAFQALADLLNAFADFLSGLVGKLKTPSEPEPSLESEFQIDFRFRLELFQKVVETSLVAEQKPGTSDTPEYLGEVLAAAAQLEDPKTLSEVA